MKGLLLKDWYQVRTSMKTMYLTVAFVLVIWVFSTSNAYVFPVSYAAIFLGILPVNLLTYDQSVGWVEYGRTLPVSKKTLVAEKYLIGLFCAAAAVVIGGLFVTVIPLRTGTAPDEDVLSLLAGSVCAILLINGISLPLLYRFGAEKARMIYVLTFAGLGALLGGVFGLVKGILVLIIVRWVLCDLLGWIPTDVAESSILLSLLSSIDLFSWLAG